MHAPCLRACAAICCPHTRALPACPAAQSSSIPRRCIDARLPVCAQRCTLAQTHVYPPVPNQPAQTHKRISAHTSASHISKHIHACIHTNMHLHTHAAKHSFSDSSPQQIYTSNQFALLMGQTMLYWKQKFQTCPNWPTYIQKLNESGMINKTWPNN
jgi:hypothetical protein